MKAGFAVSDITPELGIYLTGYGKPERLAEGVHSPLLATALVLLDSDVETAVVSLDWCFIAEDLAAEVQRGVEAAVGIPAGNVLCSCTHTHSAPQTATARTLGRTDTDPEGRGMAYAKRSIPLIVDAVKRAKAGAREAVAGFGTAKSRAGVSRRGTDENGKIARFIEDPYQICDDNLTVVRFLDRETGEDIGILIHLGCHNTAMGFDRRISSDWCGVMRERVKERYPTAVMFLNGAFGDVGPRTGFFVESPQVYGFSAGRGDGERAALEVGLRAAGDALRALEKIREFRAGLPVRTHTETICLPQALPMSESEAREKVRQYEAEMEPGTAPNVYHQTALAVLECCRRPPEPEFVFEQTVLAVGPLALAPFPFEMFSMFSLRLRKYGPFEYNLLCGNVNGCRGYMPDRGAIAIGGYEVSCRERIEPYVTVPEAGDIAVTRTLASLRELAKSASGR